MKHEGMAGCPMMSGQAGQMGMGMMRGRMGMQGGGMMMAPGMGQLFQLYGDKIEMAVENTKDGAVLKVTSKDPEVVKAIQVHMAEHMTMMKKMKEAPAKTPMAGAGHDARIGLLRQLPDEEEVSRGISRIPLTHPQPRSASERGFFI